MATYRVISDNFALGKQGTTVDSEALDGYNVDALLAGGHLAEVHPKAAKTEPTDTPKDAK